MLESLVNFSLAFKVFAFLGGQNYILSTKEIFKRGPMSNLEPLKEYLSKINLEVVRYFPAAKKSVQITSSSEPVSEKKYFDEVKKYLKTVPPESPELFMALSIEAKMSEVMRSYFNSKIVHEDNTIELPEQFQGLTLNIDISDHENLFMTDSRDYVSFVSAEIYCKLMGFKDADKLREARLVYPMYNPRTTLKIYRDTIPGYEGDTLVLNTYIPPKWKFTSPNSENCPRLFTKLVKHLIPNDKDRKYLLYWIRKSMVSRSMVYLVLCGAPGVGKNTLKRVLKSLHGDLNTVDGKKSTLTTQFNSQLSKGTLIWFDELRYNEAEENFMKEIPNDSISIESKGIDATRSTQIYGSYVISNNKPRDNYLSMDARKFVPITLTSKRLEETMTSKEIEELLNKTDPSKEEYDLQFISNLGNWIINNCDSDEWPNDEYRSDMFHILTHTSMSKWQRKIVSILTDMKVNGHEYPKGKISKTEADKFKIYGYGSMTCSALENLFESYNKTERRTLIFPEYSTVESFLTYYRDLSGNKVCKITRVPGNMQGDFLIDKTAPEMSVAIPTDIFPEDNAIDLL